MSEKDLENQNQETVNQEITTPAFEISDAELAEIEQTTLSDVVEVPTQLVKAEIKFRHPQQVLTNKEIQILLSKKEEDMSETEKTALKWLFLRLKHHNSTPKKRTTAKQNSLRKSKRRTSKASRKANR